MVYKVCPECNQTSYSACERSIWSCPFCGRDITFIDGRNTAEAEVLPKKQKMFAGHLLRTEEEGH